MLNIHMEKFLELCEEFDPRNTEDPKWKLIDFLKSKGINVSLVKNTDMLYIDTGEDTIAVTINSNEEDEGINAGYGTVDVMDTIEKMSDKYRQKGIGGKVFNPTLRAADRIRKENEKLNKDMIPAAQKALQRKKQDLAQIKSNSTSRGRNITY